MALDTEGGSLGRTGLAALTVATGALGSVVGAGACAIVRAKEPNKQQNTKTEQNFESGRKMAPRPALAAAFKKTAPSLFLNLHFVN
jgi:hypothetical protein